jgi:ribose transport system permease protein
MCGALDISIAPIAAIAGIVAATLLKAGTGPVVAAVGALAAGAGAGLLNGLLVDRLRVDPLITTLGTLSAFSGLALVVTSGEPIFGVAGLEFVGQSKVAGIQTPIVIMLVCYAVLGFALSQTQWGVRLLAVGGNSEAARRCGIRCRGYLVGAFVLSGLFSALAGLVTFGMLGTAEPAVNNSVVFDAITAVALAGVLLSGGRGSILKVLVGALIVATVANGLTLLNVPSYYTLITTGVLLVTALAIDGALSRALERVRAVEQR